MTNEQAINVLTNHLAHWQRLLKEGVCLTQEGNETIMALEMAIEALLTENVVSPYDTNSSWVVGGK